MKRLIVLYFFFCLFFLTFFSSGLVDSQDGFQYLAIARRMYFDHTFEMPVEKFPNENIPMSASRPVDGKYYSPTGLGYSLSLLPAVVVEDVFNRVAGVTPYTAFPLQTDWPVLLVASMTNAVWGALLAVALFAYLKELGMRYRFSLVMSFALLIGTNLLPYTKHTFAQMMFTACLAWVFLSVKKSANTNSRKWFASAGVWFGIMVISYNPTYLFVLPALGLYYLALHRELLTTPKWKTFLMKAFQDGITFLISALPFVLMYFWFNQVRYGGAAESGYSSAANQLLNLNFPVYVIIEGLWGLLFSPGKSIFLYSPLLILLVLFWNKLDKTVRPEVVAAVTLFGTYLWFIGTLLGDTDFLVWHGDSSWGPRYMLPTLPLLFILVGGIVSKLSFKQRLGIVTPLFLIGMGVNFLGVLLPYQIRFAGLQTDVRFNDRNFTVYEYGNEIPRYAPAFKMAKTLAKRVASLPQTFNFGPYSVKLIDGFDSPFDVGWAVWRGMQPTAVVQFDQNENQPITSVGFQIRNHQMDVTSTQSAQFTITLNGQQLELQDNQQVATISAGQEQELLLTLPEGSLQKSQNKLVITRQFDDESVEKLERKQAIFLEIFRINGVAQNISTVTYPYVSPVSQKLFGSTYYYWGGKQQDSWSIWHMHSGVFEQTFDLWWMRPLHYWDLPRSIYGSLFALNVLGILSFGGLTWWSSRNSDKDGFLEGTKLKIQLGCGKNHFMGWVNTDIRVAKKDFGIDPDYYLDISKPLKIATNSVSYLYSEHLVEHIDPETTKAFLAEAYRVLESGGVIRTATPNLRALVEKYQSKRWRDQEWLSWPEYRFIATGAEMLNIALRWWGHVYVFDEIELTRFLKEAGFTKIKVVQWGKSAHKELRNRETRKDSTLIIEATK